jgi:hypothetical protein
VTYSPPGFEWRRFKWLRLSALALVSLEIGSCSMLGHGEVLTPIFCTVPVKVSGLLVDTYALILLVSIPFAIFAMFIRQLLVPAMALCLLAVAGLAIQSHLLTTGALSCDAP